MDEHRLKVLSMDEWQFRSFVDDQFRAGDARAQEHRELLAANMALTQQIADSTAEIVETFGATKKGAQILSAIGRLAMRFGFWLSRFLFMTGSLWAIFHGHWPKGSE
jgi:hypothetical protein